MDTPICDFIENYVQTKKLRLHMPGHKGMDFSGCESFDITEIDGADVLYSASGIIEKSMANAASLFSSAKTIYSTEGSSLSIRAMLYLTALFAKHMGKTPHVLAARNIHKAFISAAALVDFEFSWLYSEEGLLSCKVTPEALRSHLEEAKEIPTALYITSPDYLGNISDISGLSKVCKEYDMLLLVDNAHGAYLNFLSPSQHPLSLGADMCCDSAHKTLPVLTGGGYLHISKTAPDFFKDNAEEAMALFASTSPSYLILRSLDKANEYLSGNYREKLSAFVDKTDLLKERLKGKGYKLTGDEKLKITISTKSYGYEGTYLAKLLYEKGIVCEFADSDFLVFMLTPEITDSELSLLSDTLLSIEKSDEISTSSPTAPKLSAALSVREAVFALSEDCPVSDSEGRILSSYTVSCPPAVPIAVCGEVIDKKAVEAFEYYGVKTIRVVKK